MSTLLFLCRFIDLEEVGTNKSDKKNLMFVSFGKGIRSDTKISTQKNSFCALTYLSIIIFYLRTFKIITC